MVSLTIISVGALGYVRTQVGTLKSISSTMTRTIATLLMQDMVSRMQANAAETWLGTASGYLSASPSNQASCYSTSGTLCTSNQMALNDLWEWKAQISSAFPAAMAAIGLVCLDSPAGTANLSAQSCGSPTAAYPLVFTLKIYWKSTPGGAYDQVQVATVQAPLLRAPSYPYPNNGPLPNT